MVLPRSFILITFRVFTRIVSFEWSCINIGLGFCANLLLFTLLLIGLIETINCLFGKVTVRTARVSRQISSILSSHAAKLKHKKTEQKLLGTQIRAELLVEQSIQSSQRLTLKKQVQVEAIKDKEPCLPANSKYF